MIQISSLARVWGISERCNGQEGQDYGVRHPEQAEDDFQRRQANGRLYQSRDGLCERPLADRFLSPLFAFLV